MSLGKFDPFNWEEVKNVSEELLGRNIDSLSDLEELIKDDSELAVIISEELARAYIKMTRYTGNKEYGDEYEKFNETVVSPSKKYAFEILKKIIESEFAAALPGNRYANLLRILKNDSEIFSEKNLPLFVEADKLGHEYFKISGSISVEFRGNSYTPQKMAIFFKDKNREVRREAYMALNRARREKAGELNGVFDKLVSVRHRMALNAGFENFRDFKHKELKRFDYTPADCVEFHESVKMIIVPFWNEILNIRKERLDLDEVRPWDTEVDFLSDKELRPFKDSEEFLEKTEAILSRLDPAFADNIRVMKKNDMFDLDSRSGKAPGGYNYPLPRTKMPFIFMNAVGLNNDLFTLLHESGHAAHTFLGKNEDLYRYLELPSEVAELASMSMELLNLKNLDVFYKDPECLKLAVFGELEGIVKFFPWMSSIDSFQQWVYTNPHAGPAGREDKWLGIRKEFGGNIDVSGTEEFERTMWHKQLHIFDAPFYYIEYGIAQLGALQVWRNYSNDPVIGLAKYKKALSLSYSKPIPEIYEAAGIKFDFGEETVRKTMEFLREQIFGLLD